MTETDVFKHSTPELYDRFMGPLLFEPYAELLAERGTSPAEPHPGNGRRHGHRHSRPE